MRPGRRRPAAPAIATEEVIAANTAPSTAAGGSGGHGVEIKARTQDPAAGRERGDHT
jgi:hypothetical protein